MSMFFWLKNVNLATFLLSVINIGSITGLLACILSNYIKLILHLYIGNYFGKPKYLPL